MEASSVGERIMDIIHYYRLNKNTFSIKLGLEYNSVIVRIVNDPSRGISYELIQKIAAVFPEINIRWFILGEGEMLLKPTFPDPKYHYIKYIHGMNKEPMDVFRILGYEDCDYAFDVFGEGMAPNYKTGDIVICKNISLNEPIAFGEAHLLFIHNNPLLRYIKSIPQTGQLKIGAENSARYEDSIINISDIQEAYIIKGVIRRETF